MLPDVWNVAEPLEVEYRRPIHQNSDQSNSGRKEIVKPPCAEETEGQELRFVAGNVNNVYLCPYSDLWASCPIYLCRDMEILGFQYKIRSFRVLIYLYIRKFLSFRLSRKQASSPLAFPIKSMYIGLFCLKRQSFGQKKL